MHVELHRLAATARHAKSRGAIHLPRLLRQLFGLSPYLRRLLPWGKEVRAKSMPLSGLQLVKEDSKRLTASGPVAGNEEEEKRLTASGPEAGKEEEETPLTASGI